VISAFEKELAAHIHVTQLVSLGFLHSQAIA
jgi:hypothetical protein